MDVYKEVVDKVIGAYGDVGGVQKRFGYQSPMAVYNWRSRGLPKRLLLDIHTDTGISVSQLKLGVKAAA